MQVSYSMAGMEQSCLRLGSIKWDAYKENAKEKEEKNKNASQIPMLWVLSGIRLINNYMASFTKIKV